MKSGDSLANEHHTCLFFIDIVSMAGTAGNILVPTDSVVVLYVALSQQTKAKRGSYEKNAISASVEPGTVRQAAQTGFTPGAGCVTGSLRSRKR
ncbi:MAG: hypothetical protein ACJ8LG_21550 [Massilia sp.]